MKYILLTKSDPPATHQVIVLSHSHGNTADNYYATDHFHHRKNTYNAHRSGRWDIRSMVPLERGIDIGTSFYNLVEKETTAGPVYCPRDCSNCVAGGMEAQVQRDHK